MQHYDAGTYNVRLGNLAGDIKLTFTVHYAGEYLSPSITQSADSMLFRAFVPSIIIFSLRYIAKKEDPEMSDGTSRDAYHLRSTSTGDNELAQDSLLAGLNAAPTNSRRSKNN